MSILLVAAPVFSLDIQDPGSILTATAAEEAIPFEYNNCGDHIEITRYTSKKYVMQIPAEIEGLPVTKIAPGAFKGDRDIAYASLPITLEEIGDEAFENCRTLTTLDTSAPSHLKKIGAYAFYNCSALEAAILPDSVEEIGFGAFAYCGMHHAVLPASLRKLPKWAFAYNMQLDTVMLPAGIERIEEDAFRHCDALHTVCYKGSAADWSVVSIDCGNDALQNAELICNYNQTKSERTGTFDPEKDQWSFSNSDVGYYVMPDETFAALTSSMSNTEKAAAEKFWETAKEKYIGCCAGMADTALLASAGILDPASLDPDATCLHDVPLTDEVRELLTYYLILENSNTMYYDRDVYWNDEIFACLEQGIPLLYSYSFYAPEESDAPLTEDTLFYAGGHAVVAYGLEEGEYEYDGIVYRKRILTYDSNLSEENKEDGYIYTDPDLDSHYLPIYVPYWAKKGAVSMSERTTTCSLDILNLHGMLNGEPYSQPELIHPLLRSFALPESYTVSSFKPDTPDQSMQTDYEAGTTGVTEVLSFPDAANGYEIAVENAQALDCTMAYDHWWYSVEGSQLNNAAFAPDGSVSITGQDTDFTITMAADEGYPATSFYKLTFSGDHAEQFGIAQTDNGYILSGSDLHDIQVTATGDAWISLSISTDAKQVLLTETAPYALSVLADSDGDGTFETTLVDRATDYLGDVNGDRVINASDAALVLIAAAKLGAEGISGLTEAQEKAADVNMWGDVNASDAALILQYAAIGGTGEDMTMRTFIMQ